MSSVEAGGENFDFPIQPDELPELNLAVDTFDEARLAFGDACVRYAGEPSPDNQMSLGLCGSLLAKTFKSSIEAIAATELDPSTRIMLIKELITDEDAVRNELFAQLAPCPGFGPITNPEQTLADLQEMAIEADDDQEFLDEVLGQFTDNLQQEVDHFAEHVLEAEEFDTSLYSRKGAIAREVGKHALDVGKLGAGIVLGAWLARRLKLI